MQYKIQHLYILELPKNTGCQPGNPHTSQALSRTNIRQKIPHCTVILAVSALLESRNQVLTAVFRPSGAAAKSPSVRTNARHPSPETHAAHLCEQNGFHLSQSNVGHVHHASHTCVQPFSSSPSPSTRWPLSLSGFLGGRS